MRFWPFNKAGHDPGINWVTPALAVGHAPMSHDHLERLRKAGIDAIVNLCAEFPDLPRIEQEAGFDVCYLPVEDEEVPEMGAMDDALEWIDESIYLGKKVLVHCRHGIVRTGTIVSAYLLRKGLSQRMVRKKLKKLRSQPSSYCQWQLLRKYGRTQCALTTREPSLEHKHSVDLNPFFDDLESIFCRVETGLSTPGTPCGREHMRCCRETVMVGFAEAVYIAHKINTMFPRDRRLSLINQAAALLAARNSAERVCPLSLDGKCALYDQRPLACRLYDHETASEAEKSTIARDVRFLSENLFLAFTGSFLRSDLVFDLNEVISGKYVQKCFHAQRENGQP